MKILVTGAAGMIGRKFCERLACDGVLRGQKLTSLHMSDVVQPAAPAGAMFTVTTAAEDATSERVITTLIAHKPDVIVHLAAIVSGEAEVDFDKGQRINLDGTRHLLDAIRLQNIASAGAYCPRVVFTSSAAVYGAPFEDVIHDDFNLTPLTSYGTQKAIGELLLADYTRRGFLDGIGIRLPTICVRPGTPNAAASGFFSNIIREPLVGLEAILPVADSVRHTHASPRSAVGFLVHSANIDGAKVGPRRSMMMPGVSVTVAEQIEALRDVAGNAAVALIRRAPDELVARIVLGWPQSFDAAKARALGYVAETDFASIVRAHMEDELSQKAA